MNHVRAILALLFVLQAATVGAEPFAYLANSGSNSVSVIDTATGTLTTTVDVGAAPAGVAVNWAGTRVYVGNSDSTVSVIRTDTHAGVTSVTAGGVNKGVAVNPAGTRIYVADSSYDPSTGVSGDTVTVIDATLDTVVTTVTVGAVPLGLAVAPDGAWVYVANSEDGTVSVIDTASNTVAATVTVEWRPQGVAVNPDGTRVYVANSGTNTISVIDTATRAVVDTLATASTPWDVAVNAAGTRLYVTNRFSANVSVFDLATNTPLPAVPLGPFPHGVAVTPSGRYVYVSVAPGTSIIDATTDLVSSIPDGNVALAFGRFIRPADPTTRLTITAPASVTAGTAFDVTVTAGDQYDNRTAGYAGTVHFTKTDAGTGSGVPADSTFVPANAGVKTFTGATTLVTTGLQTLSATDTVNGSVTGSRDITVHAAAATHFSIAAPAAAIAGAPFAFTVTALDQFDNVATGYTGTVHFTKTDAGAGSAVPANYTFVAGDNGVKAFAAGATLVTPGTRTLTATDTASAAITGTSGNIVVSAAAATHFTVAAPGSAVAGTAFNVTVTALDQFNNTATSYAGTVHFTSTDAAATLPANATLTNGVRAFSATLRTVGSRTLTVADTVAPAVTGTSPAINVTAVTTVSGPAATGTGPMTAVLTGGSPGCTFATARFIAVSGDPGSPPAGSAPFGVAFPHGLFDFRVTGCAPGSTITVTITYPTPFLVGTPYWKYGPRPGPIAAGWYMLPSTIAANTITFSIIDGQLGDDDLVANGTIVDQGGPGTVAAVPTLSTWAMIVLALALLVVGASMLGRRSAALR